MKRRKIAAVAALTATALLLTGCSGSGASEARGKTARIVLQSQPPSIDPHVSARFATSEIGMNIFETLLTVTPEYEIRPMLAESYEVSPDGKTYTFEIRPGVKFHDGSPLTPADIVASMQRWVELSSPGKQLFGGAEWTEVDADTVQLVVDKPSFAIDLSLAGLHESFPAIMKKDILDEVGNEPVQELIGTGPFTFESWRPDQNITLDRNDAYTPVEAPAEGMAGDRTAKVDRLEFDFVKDNATAVFGLETGEYDVVSEVSGDNVGIIADSKNIAITVFPAVHNSLYFNKQQGVAASNDFRKAIYYALERESIMTAAYASPEYFDLNYQMMLSSQERLWHAKAGAEEFNLHDEELAREYLEAAGYDGSRITMIVTREQLDAYSNAVVVQEQLKQIGVDVKLEAYDAPTFAEVREDPEKWDLAVMLNTPKTEPSTMAFMRSDFPGWTDSPQLTEILDRYWAAPDITAAGEIYEDLQAWYVDYLPMTKLGEGYQIQGVSDRFEPVEIFTNVPLWFRLEPANH